ncbi:DinB family protein [Flavobacterium pedocola]
MQTTFDITLSSRNILLKFLDNYSLEQLNTIPEGYSNNLIWNIGHMVVVQQMLVYNLSGLPMMVSPEMVEKFKKGTKPEGTVSQEEVTQIKGLLFSTLEQTQKDFASDVFKQYNAFTTMSGFHIRNAQEAMEFNNYHEGVHTGIMMRISKFL